MPVELANNTVTYDGKVDRSSGNVEFAYCLLCHTGHRQGSALPHRPSASSEDK